MVSFIFCPHIVLYVYFYAISNIFFKTSRISLSPTIEPSMSNIHNNVKMYLFLYILSIIKVMLLQRMLTQLKHVC